MWYIVPPMELTVRMLADAARSADGKLYVFGGQWTHIYTSTLPTTQNLAIVLVIKAEYHEALVNHDLHIELVDADGQPAGCEVDGQFAVGLPPGTLVGESPMVQAPIQVPPLRLDRYGRFEWRIAIDGQHMGTIPMTVAPPVGTAPMPGVG